MFAALVVLASLVFGGLGAAPAVAAAKPTISIGSALGNGSPIQLALTTKYKNKTVIIETGRKVGKTVKYTRLTTARVNASGAASICSTRVFPNATILRAKVGTTVVAQVVTTRRSTSVQPCPVAAPTGLDLSSTNDSGIDAADNVTRDTTLTVSGSAVKGSRVQLTVGGTATGEPCVANSTGRFTCVTAPLLATGDLVVRATAALRNVVSQPSSPLDITVDTTAPTLSPTWVSTEIGRSGAFTLRVSGDEPVFGLTASSIEVPRLWNDPTAFDPAFTMLTFTNVRTDGDGFLVTVNSNGYEATDLNLKVIADAVTDRAGNASAARWTTALPLDIYGPRIASTSIERIDSIIDYYRVYFTFDETVVNVDANTILLHEFMGGNLSDPPYQTNPISSVALDGVHTDNNQTFWVNVNLSFGGTMLNSDPDRIIFYKIAAADTVTDEYGYISEAIGEPVGYWPAQ